MSGGDEGWAEGYLGGWCMGGGYRRVEESRGFRGMIQGYRIWGIEGAMGMEWNGMELMSLVLKY